MANYIPNIIGTGELQKNASSVIQKVAQGNEESFVVTNNKPKVVMMSIDRYQELKALEEARPPSWEFLLPRIRKAGKRVTSKTIKNAVAWARRKK